jgi:hypothetical protein
MDLKIFFTLWLSRVILKLINVRTKAIFRKYEKQMLNLTTIRAHRLFNQCCINNKVLPTYTNVRLHDEAVRAQDFVQDFRCNLIDNQIKKQTEDIIKHSQECAELKSELKESINCDLKFQSLLMFLERIIETKKDMLCVTHTNKLTHLHGSEIFIKEDRDSVINLSIYPIDEKIKDIFNLGMNCHLRSKYDPLKKKIEIEKLYTQIDTEKKLNNITIPNEDQFKCELKRFGLREVRDFNKDVLTKE